MFYKEYKPEQLKKLKKIELEILKDFTVFCKKHNIDYFGVGGTAIGVMRHGGMIPWDDDIDVGFKRDDYDKFIKLVRKELSDKYTLMDAESNKNYPLMSARLMKNGTKFKEECFKDLNLDLGIFLDLYCFDNVPDSNFKMKIHGYKTWFWGKLMVLRAIDKPVLYFRGFKAKFVYFISFIIHKLLVLFHISPAFLYKKAKKNATRYNNKKTERIGYYFDPTPFTSIISRNDVFPTKYKMFDGVKTKFPNKTEAYLTKRYGDFMQLPPLDKRHNHPPFVLDFGEKKRK